MVGVPGGWSSGGGGGQVGGVAHLGPPCSLWSWTSSISTPWACVGNAESRAPAGPPKLESALYLWGPPGTFCAGCDP